MEKRFFRFNIAAKAENSTLAAFSGSIFLHFCTSAFKSKDCLADLSLHFGSTFIKI